MHRTLYCGKGLLRKLINYSARDSDYFKTPKVNPRRDVESVFNYLEGLLKSI
ncbi:MAG: hypothetical protein G01um101466_241 [Parcubacteria group bacterium Gr01-1014_66]|nr:MAG: hypothetical protein G01um101466_241 [Parcubacteria group bacterium Gr01-1014_66]